MKNTWNREVLTRIDFDSTTCTCYKWHRDASNFFSRSRNQRLHRRLLRFNLSCTVAVLLQIYLRLLYGLRYVWFSRVGAQLLMADFLNRLETKIIEKFFLSVVVKKNILLQYLNVNRYLHYYMHRINPIHRTNFELITLKTLAI